MLVQGFIRVVCAMSVAVAVSGSSVPGRAQSSGASRGSQRASRPAKPAGQTGGSFDAVAKQADAARVSGRLDEAAEHYDRALKLRPDWGEGWWFLGTILYEKDRYPQARDAFRKLVALEPKQGTAWGMLGLCEFQTREYERSLVSLLRGRSLGFHGNQQLAAVVRYHAAIIYTRLEHFEVAYDILREFVREGNESSMVIEAFGLTLLRMPFLPKEVPPDKREQVLLAGQAGFNMASRRSDEARKAFASLLARYPNSPNVHYSYGIFILNEDADAALAEFRRELEISPSHVAAILQIAFEYLKRNEHETALPWAEKAVQLAPKLFPGRNVLGRILLELGEVERAVKELEEGVRLAPDSPEMHYALARAYTRAGRKEEAAREREIFQRLEKLYREQREGPQSEGATNEPNDESRRKPRM